MERMSDSKFVLITRKTRLEELIVRFNTLGQARFYIEHMGSDFTDYTAEDEQYKQAVLEVRQALERFGRVHIVERGFVPNFLFGERDTVVAVGPDGLVANTLKYLGGQPLIGVNPDPNRWDGVLLPFCAADIPAVLPEVLREKRPIREVTMAKAVLNDGQTLYAVNDLFIGQKTHVSARYRLQSGNRQEVQSSSGVIVSTGLGSTGWLKSVLTGAAEIADAYRGGGEAIQIRGLAWDADRLVYSVREPYPSRTTGTSLVYGEVSTHALCAFCRRCRRTA